MPLEFHCFHCVKAAEPDTQPLTVSCAALDMPFVGQLVTGTLCYTVLL